MSIRLPAALLVATLSSVLPTVLPAVPVTYVIDAVHSGVTFKVRHLVNQVPGGFGNFTGTVVFDAEAAENSRAEARIQVASVDTRNEKRDAHLQNADFFETGKFPEIRFESTQWVKVGEDTYQMRGLLTIKDVTKPVSVEVKHLGTVDDPRLGSVAGFEGRLILDRTAFGLTYGQGMVGNEVQVELNIQARQQK